MADGVTGVTGGTWAKLLQICEAEERRRRGEEKTWGEEGWGLVLTGF